MVDTTYIKRMVEPYVREELGREFGIKFSSRVLALTTGGTHEFDAVSDDQKIVASIKSAGGKTARGKRPSGKIKDSEAELYYLTLVQSETRLLVLTAPEFHDIMAKRLEGRLASGITLKLIKLPVEMQTQIAQIQTNASTEVSRQPGGIYIERKKESS